MTRDANVGRIDQILRLLLGAGMLSMIVLAPQSGWWGLLGLAPLTTAIIRHCPAYSLLGIRTSAKPSPDDGRA